MLLWPECVYVALVLLWPERVTVACVPVARVLMQLVWRCGPCLAPWREFSPVPGVYDRIPLVYRSARIWFV